MPYTIVYFNLMIIIFSGSGDGTAQNSYFKTLAAGFTGYRIYPKTGWWYSIGERITIGIGIGIAVIFGASVMISIAMISIAVVIVVIILAKIFDATVTFTMPFFEITAICIDLANNATSAIFTYKSGHALVFCIAFLVKLLGV